MKSLILVILIFEKVASEGNIFRRPITHILKYLSVFIIILSEKLNMWLSEGIDLKAEHKIP